MPGLRPPTPRPPVSFNPLPSARTQVRHMADLGAIVRWALALTVALTLAAAIVGTIGNAAGLIGDPAPTGRPPAVAVDTGTPNAPRAPEPATVTAEDGSTVAVSYYAEPATEADPEPAPGATTADPAALAALAAMTGADR